MKVRTVDGIWLSVLATAEVSVTIMAASIPILRALIRPIGPAPPASFCNTDYLESGTATEASMALGSRAEKELV